MFMINRKSALVLAVIFVVLFFSVDAVAGKKKCASLKQQYQQLQKQLRYQSRGNSRNNKLSQEHNLFKRWQRCEQGKYNPSKKRHNKSVTLMQNKTSEKRSLIANTLSNVPQAMTNAIVIGGRFKGKLQQQWLDYYQRPERCLKPQSTQVFAACIEHERQQQQTFLESISFGQ